MSRISQITSIPTQEILIKHNFTNPIYGIFLSNKIKIENNTIYIQDIDNNNFSFDLIFENKDEPHSQNINTFINQTGWITYSKREEDLLKSFTHFKNFNKESFQKKKYWKAIKGEKMLFKFLTALHNFNSFDINTDYILGNTPKNHQSKLLNDEDYLHKLTNNIYGLDNSIVGLIYVNEKNESCISEYFFPANTYSFLINKAGNYNNVSLDKSNTSQSLSNFITAINNDFLPKGHFNFNNIKEFIEQSNNLSNF